MTDIDSQRRRLLLAGGTALTIALAGCSGGGDDGGDDGDDGGDDGGDGSGGADVPSAADTYLSDNDANGYDGSAVDMTGEDSITIDVGAGSDGLAFDPVAVVVDAGTEVTWEWVGVSAGSHNVAVNEGPRSFTSETTNEEGFTYTETLEDTGNYLYECSPHTTIGMHGAVIVE